MPLNETILAPTNFKKCYETYLSAVENLLAGLITGSEPKSVYEPFGYILCGCGKRLRPVLTMICCGAAGGEPFDALRAAAAIEILHNFTLVHDDIMDKSPMRRNRPTIHNKWDEPTAILTGDLMVGWGYKLLPGSSEHPRSSRILAEYTNALIEVCEGQAYDMEFNQKKNIRIEEYFKMIEKKTSRLLEASAAIGGNAGSGTGQQIEALRLFARYLGIAYQLQDDLLDLTAKQAELGKKIGKDIIEGKKTLMILWAEKKAQSSEDRKLINEFINSNGLPEKRIPEIKEMFLRLNIFDEMQGEIDKFLSMAKGYLNELPNNRHTEMLHWLADKLNRRES